MKRFALLALFTVAAAQAQTWTRVAVNSGPSSRHNTRMAFFRPTSRAVVFGGVTTTVPLNLLGDTWLWDGSDWLQTTAGPAPPARFSHAMVFDDARSEIVLFGGTGASGALNDTWVWNGAYWTRRTPAHSPSPRAGHAMEYDPIRKQVILFGGGEYAHTNETWAWNGSDWTQLAPAVSPVSRPGQDMAWDSDGQQILLYGAGPQSDQTWTWNGTTWTNVTPLVYDPPPASFYAIVSHDGHPVRISNRTDLWNGTSWYTLVTPTTTRPMIGRAGLTWDSTRLRTVLFDSVSRETWTLESGSLCTFTDPTQPFTTFYVNVAAVTLNVPARAGCSWTASTATDWLTISAPPSGTGPGTIQVTAQPNLTGVERTGTVTIGAGRTYTIWQRSGGCPPSGAPLPASPFLLPIDCQSSFTITAKAGEQFALRRLGNIAPLTSGVFSIPLQINGPAPSNTVLAHNATNTLSPVTYLPAEGVVTFPSDGTYTILLNAGRTGGGVDRIDYVRTGDTCAPSVLTTTYPGAFETIALSNSGGQTDLTVGLAPGCPSLTAAFDAPWVRSRPATVEPGFTSLTLLYDANPASARTSTLTLGTTTVPLSQGAGCGNGLPLTINVGPGRTTGSIDMFTPCTTPWQASSSASWLQVYPLEGSGLARVDFTAFPNYGTSPRTAILLVGGRVYNVLQPAATGTATERFVKLLYFSFFGRMPTDAEVTFQANSGLSREQLAMNFLNSLEFTLGGRYVAGLYVGVLNRDAEFGGWLFQRDAIARGAIDHSSAARNFVNSQEFGLRNGPLNDTQFVTLMYRQILLREPTPAEVAFQVGAVAGNREVIARNFLLSPEFAISSGPRLTAFLAYACLLQREPAPAELQAGMQMTPAQLITQIVNSQELANILQ